MKTLILYASSHGTVRQCAEELRELLEGEVELVDLKTERLPALEPYGKLVIGGSIHAGQLQGRVKRVFDRVVEALPEKRLGLFLCSMEKSREQFEKVYPAKLRAQAAAEGLFGGRMEPRKMNPLLRFVVKKVAGSLETRENIDRQAIADFARSMRDD